MWRRQALFWFVLAFVLIFSSFGIVSAQVQQYVEGFDAVGQTHLLRYTDDHADQAVVIKTTVAAIIPVYEKFWNAPSGGGGSLPMDFRLFIDVGALNPNASADASAVSIQSLALPVPSVPAAWTGKTEAAKASVCAVQLYADANIYSTAQRVQFEVALDLAQCYLLHYAAPPISPPDWWFKGLTYWMAVQVYPPPTDVLAKVQKEYSDNYNQNLLNAGEEALYFWEYLLGQSLPATLKASIPGSLPDLVNGLKNLSGSVTFFTPDLFYDYVQHVQANQLLWQPSADVLAQNETVAFFPQDVELSLEENSIVIETVALPQLQSDEGITIEADDFAANGVLASVSAGANGTFPLSSGASVQICGAPSSVTIIAGRGSQGSIPDAGLKFSKVESCKQPPQATAEATPVTGLPSCVVGTFNVRFPFMEQYVQYTEGTWQYTFNADGSFLVETHDLTTKSKAGLTIVMNYAVAGNVVLVADATTANRYNIAQWTSELQPGASLIGTDSNGFSIDESQVLQGANNQLTAPPAYLTCASADAQNPTVTLSVSGAGATYDYILTRIP